MDLLRALQTRSSIRAFKPDPVDEAQLRRVLDAAREAPSWSNTQPYLVAVANGDKCEALRADMLAAADTRVPEGEYPFPLDYPSPLKERRQATGYGLYGVLGIDRQDKAARAEQFRRNYAFFGAPVVVFLFCHEALGVYAALDAGIWLQSFMLAATAEGLGTCAQAALASYPAVVRKHFDVPPGYQLICGIALGHVADDKVNGFRPARLRVDDMLIRSR